MAEMEIAFLIWGIVGAIISIYGLYVAIFQKEKAVGFWANADMFPVTDVRAYNRALGKLLVAFGMVFVILGIPLLQGQNSPAIILTALGVMFEVVITMGIYILVIEKKYRKK